MVEGGAAGSRVNIGAWEGGCDVIHRAINPTNKIMREEENEKVINCEKNQVASREINCKLRD